MYCCEPVSSYNQRTMLQENYTNGFVHMHSCRPRSKLTNLALTSMMSQLALKGATICSAHIERRTTNDMIWPPTSNVGDKICCICWLLTKMIIFEPIVIIYFASFKAGVWCRWSDQITQDVPNALHCSPDHYLSAVTRKQYSGILLSTPRLSTVHPRMLCPSIPGLVSLGHAVP